MVVVVIVLVFFFVVLLVFVLIVVVLDTACTRGNITYIFFQSPRVGQKWTQILLRIISTLIINVIEMFMLV